MSRFVCLMYHDVRQPGEAGADRQLARLSPSICSYSVTTDQFREHLTTIGRNRWMDPAELRCPTTATSEDSTPRVLLTFDDGWVGSILEAGPILKEFGARAIVFVTTGLIGHPLFVSESLLSDIPQDTFEIGAHTVTHPFLAECTSDVIRRELTESRCQLEDILGRCVDSMSLPNGSLDERVLKIARECGYETILTSETTMNWAGDRVIGRVAVRSGTTTDAITQWAAGSLGSEGWRRQALEISKKLLGPTRYRRLRGWALGEEHGQDDMGALVAEHQSSTSPLIFV
jgi:peptidoglycan/xylan/chitin deacetylase (PgdA/CDA1 family)